MNNILNEGKRVINEAIHSLTVVSELMNESFDDAVKALINANKIIISGVGKSGNVANKIAATMSSLGLPAIFMHPVDALHGDLGIVQDNDVAILLSKSGSTEEIVRLVPYLKSKNIPIISIVSNENSYLATHSDIFLNAFVEKEACPFNLAPTNSTTVAMVLGDALAVASVESRKFTMEGFARLHPLGQLGRNITLKVKDVMHTGEDLPIITKDHSFKDAVIEISKKGLGCVLVLNDDRSLEGLITDGDVRRVLEKESDLSGIKATDIMTINPITIDMHSYLGEAMNIMENRNSQISVLAVTDEKECKGIIRIHDIIRSNI